MKRLFIFMWMMCALLGSASAATLSFDQKEVQAFIKKLYSIDSLTFEMGRFNGKYNPKKQLALLSLYLSKDLLSSAKDLDNLVGLESMRHPSLSNEDLSQMSGVDPTKNPKMHPPVLKGDSAYVDVYPDSGRTIYFLKKTPDGWRIINTASYNAWPLNFGTCPQPFYLVKPTPEQEALDHSDECAKKIQSQMPKK